MCDKDVDSLSGQIMRVQERIDRHGQIAPPVGEDKIDGVVILNGLFISFQHRSEAHILLLLGLVDSLIVIDWIGLFCQDLHCLTAGFIRNPGRNLTGISHKAILIDPDTCARIRVNIRRKIRVAYSAEIDSECIAAGSAAFCCFRRCGVCSRRCVTGRCLGDSCRLSAGDSAFLLCIPLRRFFILYSFFLFSHSLRFLCICHGFLGSRRILSACSSTVSVSTGTEPEE